MKKRILIFSLTYHPFIGGAEIAIKEITDRIPEGEIEFDMITLRFNRDLPRVEKIGNVTVHRIGFTKKGAEIGDGVRFPLFINKYIFPVVAFLKAKKMHAHDPYDVVWCMLANYGALGALLFKRAYPHIPYILTLQDGSSAEEIKKRTGVFFPFLREAFIKADLIQVISIFLQNVARDIGYTGNVVVVPNAVNTKHFSQPIIPSNLNHLRNKLGMSDEKVYLITTTRLVLTRGVEDIINALPHLPAHAELLVLGIGPDEATLRDIAKHAKVEERVKFLGHIEHAELPKYLKIADIFVRPSTIEGFGNSFVEAMAARIPVVATPVGGIPDFLFDPDKNPGEKPTGLFCGVRDPKSIAVQVKRLIEDEELKNELVENAYNLVMERYDWNMIADDMRTKVFLPFFEEKGE